MNNIPFNKGPFNIKYDIYKPIHFQPPKEQLKPIVFKFNKGPFNCKYDDCKPIHFEPPRELPPLTKIKKPWNQACVKSDKIFRLEIANYNII